jgi:hypothetical protein
MEALIYNTALATHIIGITIMAGTTFLDFIIFNQFIKSYRYDKIKNVALENLLFIIQKFIGIGMLVILLSGITMMVYMHQVWGQQIWFRIKMGILLLIIINGFVFRRRLGLRLKKLLGEQATGNSFEVKFSKVKNKTSTIQMLQIFFFIVIFVLSAFKFN